MAKVTVTDTDRVTWIVCEVIDLDHQFPKVIDWVQLNICEDDGRPVRPEGGVSVPRHLAEQWMKGEIRVKINKHNTGD